MCLSGARQFYGTPCGITHRRQNVTQCSPSKAAVRRLFTRGVTTRRTITFFTA
ncbi:hypothetical protein ACFPRL_30945 [Pseudoclavibacter helvolus]